MAQQTIVTPFFQSIDPFLEYAITFEGLPSPKYYFPGRRMLDPYPVFMDGDEEARIRDLLRDRPEDSFESALLARLHAPFPHNVILPIGEVGSGKSTSIRYVLSKFLESTAASVPREFCRCPNPECHVRSLLIDCKSQTAKKNPQRYIAHELSKFLVNAVARRWSRILGLHEERDSALTFTLGNVGLMTDLQKWTNAEPGVPMPPFGFPVGLPWSVDILKGQDASMVKAAYHELAQRCSEEIRLAVESGDLDDTVHYLRAGFAYLVSDCPVQPPLPIVVDNLDQLPKRIIDQTVMRLCDIFTDLPRIRLIVPLRPSSLVRRPGFIGLVDMVQHYAPDNAAIVLGRILDGVLLRSAASLSDEPFQICWSEDELTPASPSGMKCFSKSPDSQEVDFLIVASYLLACMLREATEEPGAHDQTFERVFELHPKLRRINASGQVFKELARIICSLTGNSVRATLLAVSRYFQWVFSKNRGMINELLNGLETRQDNPNVGPFGSLAASLLLNTKNMLDSDRIVNVFAPQGDTANYLKPSLTMLRILQHLAHTNTLSFDELSLRLARFGIPRSVCQVSLRSMKHSERRLVWISREENDGEWKGSVDITIAECGLHYQNHLVFQFDYLWPCGQDLYESRNLPILPEKVANACKLLGEMMDVDLLQLAYCRGGFSSHDEFIGANQNTMFCILPLVVASFASICETARRVLELARRNSGENSYAKDIGQPVDTLLWNFETYLGRLLFIAGDPVRAFLDESSQRELMGKARVAVLGLRSSLRTHESEEVISVDAVERALGYGWRETAEERGGFGEGLWMETEDAVSVAARLLSGFLVIGNLKAAEKSAYYTEYIGFLIGKYNERILSAIRPILSAWPSAEELLRGLERCEEDLKTLTGQIERSGAGPATSFAANIDRCQSNLRQIQDELGKARYSHGERAPDVQTVDVRKLAFNRLVRTCEDISRLVLHDEDADTRKRADLFAVRFKVPSSYESKQVAHGFDPNAVRESGSRGYR